MTAAFGIGRSPEQSAGAVVRLATFDVDGPTGTFQDGFARGVRAAQASRPARRRPEPAGQRPAPARLRA